MENEFYLYTPNTDDTAWSRSRGRAFKKCAMRRLTLELLGGGVRLTPPNIFARQNFVTAPMCAKFFLTDPGTIRQILAKKKIPPPHACRREKFRCQRQPSIFLKIKIFLSIS